MKRGETGRAAPWTSALALGSALGLCLAVIAAQAAYAQDQGRLRTSSSERAAVPGSLLNRISMANARHREAWEKCDREAAHATLVVLYELVGEARKISQAATGAGAFATIHPGDAADDYAVALGIYQQARQRTLDECSQHDHVPGGRAPADAGAGTAPTPQRQPIESVIDDMEEAPEAVLGPTFGPRTGGDVDQSREPALGDPLQDVTPVPPVTFEGASDASLEVDLTGTWSGRNYQCGSDTISETVQVTQYGMRIVGRKITGDRCVAAGQVSFARNADGSVRCVIGTPENPASRTIDGTISHVTATGFRACNVDFTRVR